MTFRVKDAGLRRCTTIGPLFMLCFSILSLLITIQRLKVVVPILEEQLATFRPPPTKSSSNLTTVATTPNYDSFSACLLTMDDNHFLIEWLAYHYHTLPLRYLIVAVDPKSKTSPTAIFQKWRTHGMVIEQWSDQDYFYPITQHNLTRKKFPKLSYATNLHRLRQVTFYEQCMKRLKEQGQTWTILIDTDEYLAFNTHTEKHLNTTVQTPGAFLTFIQQELTKQENETKLRTRFQKPPCIMIPRLRYGSKESTTQQIFQNIPSNLNASAFVTLRWRKHAPLNNIKVNRVTKAIVDVSQIPFDEIIVRIFIIQQGIVPND